MNLIVVALAAYLMGSVSFAVVVSRAFSLPDPRSYGSGNPGATNVLRTGRKAAAILTLIGDAAKGWLAVFLAYRVGAEPVGAAAVASVAVVLGHVFPVFHRFAGGKGVSTAAGALFALSTWLGLGTLVTWIVIAVFFRISSLAAIAAAISAPVFTAMLFDFQHPYLFGVAAMAVILLVRHKSNIAKLLAGTEGRIGERAS
ncbi:MAG: glycerol-3-phosphate 1-O-acyltransferase PlsY [Betaproteobacteria bacterium]|nr:MAG: glycerol-3-phosphate 1-O-acyltransferase PlsY [Betaproteobacteria bacterium]